MSNEGSERSASVVSVRCAVGSPPTLRPSLRPRVIRSSSWSSLRLQNATAAPQPPLSRQHARVASHTYTSRVHPPRTNNINTDGRGRPVRPYQLCGRASARRGPRRISSAQTSESIYRRAARDAGRTTRDRPRASLLGRPFRVPLMRTLLPRLCRHRSERGPQTEAHAAPRPTHKDTSHSHRNYARMVAVRLETHSPSTGGKCYLE